MKRRVSRTFEMSNNRRRGFAQRAVDRPQPADRSRAGCGLYELLVNLKVPAFAFVAALIAKNTDLPALFTDRIKFRPDRARSAPAAASGDKSRAITHADGALRRGSINVG